MKKVRFSNALARAFSLLMMLWQMLKELDRKVTGSESKMFAMAFTSILMSPLVAMAGVTFLRWSQAMTGTLGSVLYLDGIVFAVGGSIAFLYGIFCIHRYVAQLRGFARNRLQLIGG